MSKVGPVKPRLLIAVVERCGWGFVRQKGSHKVYERRGCARPIVIDDHGCDIPTTFVNQTIKNLGISREKYFELLRK